MVILKGFVVGGLTIVDRALCKCTDSACAEGGFYLVTPEDVAGLMSVAVDGPICIYIVESKSLSEASTYDISGKVYPVGSTVYLSITSSNMVEMLKEENAIARCVSGSDGSYSFSNISGITSITVWTPADFTYVEKGSITCDATMLESDITGKNVVYTSFIEYFTPCDVCGGTGVVDGVTCERCHGHGKKWGTQRFEVEGTAPVDIGEVYAVMTKRGVLPECSICSGSGETETGARCSHCYGTGLGLTERYLNENILGNAYYQAGTGYVEETGAFKVGFVDKDTASDNQIILLWGLSETGGNISISNITIKDGSCLSGDTLIWMADGTQKRMEDVRQGDMVVSDSFKATRVLSVSRGNFNDHHILYHFADGTVVNETHPHRFYNVDQGFFQRLGLWNIGDKAITREGLMTALVSKEVIHEQAEMFGIWTESGTYFANGLLSGEAECNEPLLEEATAEQIVDIFLSSDNEAELSNLMGLEGGFLP